MAEQYVDLTVEKLQTPAGVAELNRILLFLTRMIAGDGETVRVYYGYATPEGNVTAGIGSLYMRKDGGADTSVYVKESGTDSNGWIAK